MPFNIAGARQAGYTDEEIIKELESAGKFDIRGALSAGYFIRGITPALEMTGAVAGAVGGPIGSALGFGAGGGAGRGVEGIAGLREPETAMGAMARTARDIGIGMLPMGIAKVAKIPGAIKAGITKGTKVTKAVQKVGGEMLPSVAGESGLKGAQGTFKEV